MVAYERWSPTRGSIYSNLTLKLFEFWKSGRLWEVVAYERWSQREVQLYLDIILCLKVVGSILHIKWIEPFKEGMIQSKGDVGFTSNGSC